MNDNRVESSKYIWVAMVAVFLLAFGGVWIASSPRETPQQDEPTARADTPTYEAYDRAYTSRVPAEPPMPSAPVFGAAPADPPSVVVTPLAPQAFKPNPTPQVTTPARPQPKKITSRDMFPVGDITRDLPKVAHPYRQVAEQYPTFEYHGQLWSATGRFVLSSQADLVPTGQRLATGQVLYAINDGGAPDGILFVQSEVNPDKFAVYRAT